MLRVAERRVAAYNVLDKGNRVVAHPFAYGQFGLVEENLRHEFRDAEARLTLRFTNGVVLTAVWPPDPDELDPFFYLLDGDVSLRTPADVRRSLPSIGIVPVLSPIDHEETTLTQKHLRENLDSRLASRHFRNQLLLLGEESPGRDYAAFLAFAAPWLPELRLDHVRSRIASGGVFLDLFFIEAGSRIPKEAFWAGDGLQIWLQILLHAFRLQESDVIVLDEPDVFLHPDLQRRLVHLLESIGAQTITATHSPELLAEAPPEAVVWIDKSRRRSVFAPDTAVLTELMTAIGTQFNIRLARALRAKQALFVEGDDMKLLRHLAEAVGARRVAREIDMAVIPLRGYSNWDRIEPFVWLVKDLLHDAVEVLVVLDRDYRTAEQVRRVKSRLAAIGVQVHVWRRKELESYLLEPPTMAAALGIEEPLTRSILESITLELKDSVTESMANERARHVKRSDRPATRRRVEAEVDGIWADPHRRLTLCPPKEVLARVNQQMESEGKKATSFQRLARTMKERDVPDEIKNFLLNVDGVQN